MGEAIQPLSPKKWNQNHSKNCFNPEEEEGIRAPIISSPWGDRHPAPICVLGVWIARTPKKEVGDTDQNFYSTHNFFFFCYQAH